MLCCLWFPLISTCQVDKYSRYVQFPSSLLAACCFSSSKIMRQNITTNASFSHSRTCIDIWWLDIALVCLQEFDTTYGPAWHCIVGTSFGSYVTHSLGGFLYFSVDKAYILLFRTAVEPLSHPWWGLEPIFLHTSVDLAQMCNLNSCFRCSAAVSVSSREGSPLRIQKCKTSMALWPFKYLGEPLLCSLFCAAEYCWPAKLSDLILHPSRRLK